MKKLTIIFLVCTSILCSCTGRKIRGNGILRTETRDLPSFETITCDGSYEILVEYQAKQSFTLDADENLLPLIKTEVKNNSLHVYTESNLQPSKEIRIIAGVPKLSEFSVQGFVQGEINSIDSTSFFVDIKGSSKLRLSGKTTELKINISGSSNIDASSLPSEKTKVRIYGSGDIHVYTTNMLDAQINGSGTVKYRGTPQNVTQGINGSGKIEKE
jgi:hypothetical protein